MSRLDRYIFREVLVPTLVALLALTFMLVARDLGTLLELLVRGSASAEDILKLTLAFVPGAMTFTIPMAVLIGVLSGFGRLSADSEAIAIRASGISIAQVLRPVLILGIIAWGANLALSVWIAPRAAAQLTQLTAEIDLMRQIPLRLKPRVFNEDIENLVIYVRDMSPDGREWSGVFIADVTTPRQIQVTWARSARLSGDASGDQYEVTLSDGSTEIVSLDTPQDSVSSGFTTTTIPIPLPERRSASGGPAAPQKKTSELLALARSGEASFRERVEFHRRLALPFASIAFILIGLPLGIRTRRGGRAIGLVFSALLMLAYYMLYIGGTRTAGGNALVPAMLGTWMANGVFAILGIILLLRSERAVGGGFLQGVRPSGRFVRLSWIRRPGRLLRPLARHSTWFRTLDLYVVRGFLFFLILVLVAFSSLVIVVTLFEILPDIVENDIGIGLIAAYFFFYLPQILYLVVPLAVLVAVFIILGSLTRSNETLAVRAGAISLYRIAWPVIVVALFLSAAAYAMGDYMLPYTNQMQDAYRDTIKGRAPQTYMDPSRKWMAGSGNQIYFYNYFDPEQNTFADLSIFEFDSRAWILRQWTFASRASRVEGRWRLEGGWTRSIAGSNGRGYEPFQSRATSRPVDPPDYFKREVRIASQMNYPELKNHIEDLRRAGFDVGGLTVDLHTKLSFPFVSVIMAMIATPFALSTGRRGAFYGIGIAIVIGIAYWAAFEFFDKLGGINQLSPVVAAWFPNLIFGLGGFWMLLKVRT